MKRDGYLEKCATWFDGCNDCSVEDGKIDACTLKYCRNNTKAFCKEKVAVGD